MLADGKSHNCLEGDRFPPADNYLTLLNIYNHRLEGKKLIIETDYTVLKSCTRCHIEKPITDFYIEKRVDKQYVRSECKGCRKELSRKYGLRNRAKINLRRRSEESAYKTWRKQYDLVNKKRQGEQEKAWRLTPQGIFCSIYSRAHKYKIPFNLIKDKFIEWYSKTAKICVYCGIDENENKKYRGHNSLRLTIDRKNSLNGYEIDNIVLACAICNTVKSNILTFEQMLEVGKMINKNRNKGLIKESRRNKHTRELGGCYDAAELLDKEMK